MQKAFIRFSSITYAQLARDVLMKYSIRSQIKRLSVNTTKSGCGYVLIPYGDAKNALRVLDRENVKNMGIGLGDFR